MSANLPQSPAIALIAMGSNQNSGLGDARETLQAAQLLLREAGLVIRVKSEIYRTPAFPLGSGPDYANAAICVDFDGSAPALLALCQKVEAQIGRTRTERWGPRCIDLDVLAVGDQVLPSEQVVKTWMDLPMELQAQTAPKELILPHPRIQDRAFVLVPLLDVAPDWQHPLLRQTVRQMHDALPGYLLDDIKLYQ